jgi:DNA-binding transcriptional LysR family regulator
LPGALAHPPDPLTSVAEVDAPYQSMASYARHLRPLLPPGAFRTDPNRLLLVLINLAILGLGWAMASKIMCDRNRCNMHTWHYWLRESRIMAAMRLVWPQGRV